MLYLLFNKLITTFFSNNIKTTAINQLLLMNSKNNFTNVILFFVILYVMYVFIKQYKGTTIGNFTSTQSLNGFQKTMAKLLKIQIDC